MPTAIVARGDGAATIRPAPARRETKKAHWCETPRRRGFWRSMNSDADALASATRCAVASRASLTRWFAASRASVTRCAAELRASVTRPFASLPLFDSAILREPNRLVRVIVRIRHTHAWGHY